MKETIPITTLFVDIGGVLLTDGWNHHARQRAAKAFHLDYTEMDERHRLVSDTYGLGKLTLKEYLSHVVFYQKRSFTHARFWKFMKAQSEPFPQMIELVRRLKKRHHLKIAVVSNEGRDLNAYRIEKFKLADLVDFFISSCFVHLHKPDADIFRLALDVAQTPVEQIVYIENTAMFVQIAESMGIRGIMHTDYKTTRAQLSALGLDI